MEHWLIPSQNQKCNTIISVGCSVSDWMTKSEPSEKPTITAYVKDN
jgi:hypothetical protein